MSYSGAVGASRGKPNAETQTGKPHGVLKRHSGKTSKRMRQAATKGHATKLSRLDENTPQAIPASITKSRGTKIVVRPPTYQANMVQPQGVRKRKGRNGKCRHRRGLGLTKHNLELHL